MMKKVLIFSLAALLCLPLFGCKKERVGLTLPGNPTTGFVWEVTECGENVTVGEYEYEQENKDPNVAGAGGSFFFPLTGVSAGECSVTLVYHQPWDTEAEPAETRTFTVTVAEDLSVSYTEN